MTEYKHPETGEIVEADVFFETLKQTAMQSRSALDEATAPADEAREALKAKIEAITKSWEIQNAEVLQLEASAKVIHEVDDATIRDYAVKYFKETGEKQIGFGISVRVGTEYVYDEDKAREYAIDHEMPHLLKVDGTKFKKFASVTPLDFVSTEPKVSAVVSYKNDE